MPTRVDATVDTVIKSPFSIFPAVMKPTTPIKKYSEITTTPVGRNDGSRVQKPPFGPTYSDELRRVVNDNTQSAITEDGGNGYILSHLTRLPLHVLGTASHAHSIRGNQDTGSVSKLSPDEQEQHVDIPAGRGYTPCAPQHSSRRITDKPSKVVKLSMRRRGAHASANPRNIAGVAEPARPNASKRPIASSSGGGPSEEDLFYLLIHRQRQRKDVETCLMTSYKELEDANAQLSQQNQQYKSQLDAGRERQNQQSSELISQKAALEDFKARFSKLKTFVNGLGSDYKCLREEADKIKSSQQALSKDKEDVNRDVQAVRTASSAVEHSLRSTSSQLVNVRASVAPLDQMLHDTQETLRIERGILSKEQRRTQRLETYLVQVASTQNRFSIALQDEQKAMLKQLNLVTKKVTAVQDATESEPPPLKLPGLGECLRLVKAIHNADRVEPADIAIVAEAVTTLSQRLVRYLYSHKLANCLSGSLKSYQKSSIEAVQAASESNVSIGNQLVTHITTLLESFRPTPVKEQQFNDLREEKIRLEEQLKSSDDLMREVRGSKLSAEARETHLRKTADSLIGEMRELRDRSTVIQKVPPSIDEREMISTWLLKYNSANDLLKVAQDRIRLRENDIRKREETIETMKKQWQRFEAERVPTLQSLKQAEGSQPLDEHTSGVLKEKVSSFFKHRK